MISSYQLYHYSQRCQLNLTARQFMNYYLLYIYIFIMYLLLGGARTSMCHFSHMPIHLSVCPSIAYHIAGTIHHLIIIFGIYMCVK